MSRYEIVVTPSGASALRERASGEVMHPGAGPLIESQRLYVTPSRLVARLAAEHPEPLVLFDVGLGAGSNAAAAWCASEQRTQPGRKLEIISFDRTDAALDVALRPEHAAAFGFDAQGRCAGQQLLAERCARGLHTRWQLRLGDFAAEFARAFGTQADVVFWDPFSPRVDPSAWSVAIFSALRRCCRSGATVHTYSAATSTRAALLLAGFAVGLEYAASNKQRHSTMAAIDLGDLRRPLPQSWLEHFARSNAGWPHDAPVDAVERISALPQFRRP